MITPYTLGGGGWLFITLFLLSDCMQQKSNTQSWCNHPVFYTAPVGKLWLEHQAQPLGTEVCAGGSLGQRSLHLTILVTLPLFQDGVSSLICPNPVVFLLPFSINLQLSQSILDTFGLLLSLSPGHFKLPQCAYDLTQRLLSGLAPDSLRCFWDRSWGLGSRCSFAVVGVSALCHSHHTVQFRPCTTTSQTRTWLSQTYLIFPDLSS